MATIKTKLTALLKTAQAHARPAFDEFMRYAKVELSPPTPADFRHFRKSAEEAAKSAKNVKTDMKRTGKRLGEVTVAEAWLNTLVAIEVITWFYMGEVIGRRHFVGYKV